jgi:quinol-cytochrome oxidoreductase complex cytochrome b subunit
MNGIFGIIIGLVLIGLALAGLGTALHEMMTHAADHDVLITLGGLGTFVVSSLVLAYLAD